MAFSMSLLRFSSVSLRTFSAVCLGLQVMGGAEPFQTFPSPETLTYRIEWRMVTAGEAKLQLTRNQADWAFQLNIDSAGLVSRLFRVEDIYKVTTNDKFCALSSSFEAEEGKRRVNESQTFDNVKHKSAFEMHDLVKNTRDHHEMDIAPCTHEILGALAFLRQTKLEPGKSITVPIANSKKVAYAKIEAQATETILVDGKSYPTIRYEAFVFDNVVFRRHGSLFLWLTDDATRSPVQLRLQMGFPIGNITLQLEKAMPI